MPENFLTLPSYAKINWLLRVLGRRADGYHELVTVFQTISLADALTFRTVADNDAVTLTATASFAGFPLDESNLIVRAARALQERYGVRRGAQIHIAKHIPMGGGLGGGSSNAAVALLGLAHLWQVPAQHAELCAIGAQLGADVPFFLMGGTALGTGRGTDLAVLDDISQQPLLVLAPNVHVATGPAFRALQAPDLTNADAVRMLTISRAARDFAKDWPQHLHNDFEAVVLAQHPEIASARDALHYAGASAVRLSGSGACLFGVFAATSQVTRALTWFERHRSEHPDWRIFPSLTITRSSYHQALGACAEFLVT